MKYIVLVGGTIPRLGKSITGASIGAILKAAGFVVSAIKINPEKVTYDTPAPLAEQGEVYVLDDGSAVDVDLGTYERFLGDVTLTRDHHLTTDKIYHQLFQKEEFHQKNENGFLKVPQVVPHITNAIQDWIERAAALPVDDKKQTPDVCLIELGSMLDDADTLMYLEAFRQLEKRVGTNNFCLLFLAHIVTTDIFAGPQKSKFARQGLQQLTAAGLKPAIVGCRAIEPLQEKIKLEIAKFANLSKEHVISVHDVDDIYQVLPMLRRQNIFGILAAQFKRPVLRGRQLDNLQQWRQENPCPWSDLTVRQAQLQASLQTWELLVANHSRAPPKKVVSIAIVRPFTGLFKSNDLSVTHALGHAARASGQKLKIFLVNAQHLENPAKMAPAKAPKKIPAIFSALAKEDPKTLVFDPSLETDSSSPPNAATSQHASQDKDKIPENKAAAAPAAPSSSSSLSSLSSSSSSSFSSSDSKKNDDTFRRDWQINVLHFNVNARDKFSELYQPSGSQDRVIPKKEEVTKNKNDEEELHVKAWGLLSSVDGILLPSTVGNVGVEGMIAAAKYAREYQKPFLGVGTGLHVAIIEFCRHVLKLEGANSREFDPTTPHPVVVENKSGTQGRGGWIKIQPKTLAASLYQQAKSGEIQERHGPNQFEVNPIYVQQLEAAGLCFSGESMATNNQPAQAPAEGSQKSQDKHVRRVEMAELPHHLFFLGAQFHPEFLSRLFSPSPLFLGFISAAVVNRAKFIH